jgi:hypothetical protein
MLAKTLFPVFIFLVFFNKVFPLLGGLVAVIGWLGFGGGVIVNLIFLLQKNEWM